MTRFFIKFKPTDGFPTDAMGGGPGTRYAIAEDYVTETDKRRAELILKLHVSLYGLSIATILEMWRREPDKVVNGGERAFINMTEKAK